MPGFRDTPSSPVAPYNGTCDATERSGTYAAVGIRTVARTCRGLPLGEYLPYVLSNDGVEAAVGEMARVRDFLAREFPSLTEEGLGSTPQRETLEAKLVYLNTKCDLVELRHRDRTIGILVGEPEDWSSYYVRMFAVVSEYQRPSLIRRFARECLFGPLTRQNIQRVTSDTSPANLAMSRILTELHFHVTGHQLSERWGPMVQYTKFLDPACEAAFHARFGRAAPPGSNGARKEKNQ